MAKNKYELLAKTGKHRLRSGQIVKPGDVVESETDLAKTFPGKFRAYQQGPEKKAVNSNEAEEESALEASEKPAAKKADTKKEAEDATDTFLNPEDAQELGITVQKVGSRYNVISAEEGLLNEKPITKKAATALIDDMFEEEEEEE